MHETIEEGLIDAFFQKSLALLPDQTEDQKYHEGVQDEEFYNRLEDLKLNLFVMQATRENYAFRHLYSCRRFIGRFIVLFKRIVRKCLKWYLEPVCFQQTDFNNATTHALERLMEMQTSSAGALTELNQQMKDISLRIEREKKEINLSIGQIQAELAQIQEQVAANGVSISELQMEKAQLLKQLAADDEKIAANGVSISELQMEKAQLLEQLAADDEKVGEMQAAVLHLREELTTYGVSLGDIQTHMVQLREQGAFDYIVRNEPTIRRSASQSGEDGIISHVLRAIGIPERNCSYLDLGANHAKYLSNTYYFYQLGARGVLVEANPGLIGELKLYRSGDVIVNRCISNVSEQTVPFYVLNGDGLSTPKLEEAEAAIAANPSLCITRTVEVKTITVNELMERYFQSAPIFLNIDIEGEEMSILQSIDWTKYRPLAVSVEVIPYRTHLVIGEKRQEICSFMEEQDYVEYAFSGINSIFLDKKQLAEVLHEYSF